MNDSIRNYVDATLKINASNSRAYEALELWQELIENFNPVQDFDSGDYCVFCGEEFNIPEMYRRADYQEPEHEPDCIYLQAKKLIEES